MTRHSLGFTTLVLAAIAVAAPLAAQRLGATPSATVRAQGAPPSTGQACRHALPAPDCRAFYIATAGGYISTADGGGALPLVVVDWVWMVNVGPLHAIGGSLFATFDEYGFNAGPTARYRRWLERGRSLDLAVGTPVAGSVFEPGSTPELGSIFGLVKYSPVHRFGVALRPAYLRRSASNFCCMSQSEGFLRVSVGGEFAF